MAQRWLQWVYILLAAVRTPMHATILKMSGRLPNTGHFTADVESIYSRGFRMDFIVLLSTESCCPIMHVFWEKSLAHDLQYLPARIWEFDRDYNNLMRYLSPDT